MASSVSLLLAPFASAACIPLALANRAMASLANFKSDAVSDLPCSVGLNTSLKASFA